MAAAEAPSKREIRTAQLVLRPFRSDDVEAIAGYANDEDYRRYLRPTQPSAKEFVAHNISVDWSVQCSWVITLDDAIVGTAFLGINDEDDAAELSCLLAPCYWGQGIGTEAAGAALEHAFVGLDLAKVVGRTDPRHDAALGLMKTLGMQPHGATHTDEVIYELTRDEWSRARSGAR
ncbi:MAG TPA: GNAT family N-acetyltransferase [Acidimicrobiia bacterium]|jgi:RimJ/RimL family protein N-acetyltransferase